MKKVGPEDPTEELTADKNHFVKKNVKKKQADDVKGIIFLRCNKNPVIENRVLDRLYDAATKNGIYIENQIVNELKGMDKLKRLIEEKDIKYILINNLNEYSRNCIEQEKLVENAFRNGISILVGDNGFLPIIPPDLC